MTIHHLVRAALKSLLLLVLVTTSFGQTGFQADAQRIDGLKKLAGTWKVSGGGELAGLDAIETNSSGYANLVKAGKKLTTVLLKEQSPGVYLLEGKYMDSIQHKWLKLTFNANGTFAGEGGLVPHDKKAKALTYKLSGKKADAQ